MWGNDLIYRIYTLKYWQMIAKHISLCFQMVQGKLYLLCIACATFLKLQGLKKLYTCIIEAIPTIIDN